MRLKLFSVAYSSICLLVIGKFLYRELLITIDFIWSKVKPSLPSIILSLKYMALLIKYKGLVY